MDGKLCRHVCCNLCNKIKSNIISYSRKALYTKTNNSTKLPYTAKLHSCPVKQRFNSDKKHHMKKCNAGKSCCWGLDTRRGDQFRCHNVWIRRHSAFPFLLRRRRAHATLWFEPQACMKSDLVCTRWNNSYGCVITNATCWSLPQIGWVSRWASAGYRGLRIAAPVITAPQGSSSDHGSSLRTLFTFWSATPSTIIPDQKLVYLDSGATQHLRVISVEGDSENIALGFHPAGNLLKWYQHISSVDGRKSFSLKVKCGR